MEEAYFRCLLLRRRVNFFVATNICFYVHAPLLFLLDLQPFCSFFRIFARRMLNQSEYE